MRIWFTLLWVIFFITNAYCVKRQSPVVLPAIANNQMSLARIDKMNATAFDLFLADPMAARKLSENALIQSKTINYKNGIGESLLNIGVTYWSQSYYPISLLYIDTAIQYFPKSNHTDLSIAYRYISRNYADLKDYKSAIYYLQIAEGEAGTNKFLLEEVVSERSLIFTRSRQFKKAISVINNALKLCRQLHKTGNEAVLYGRLTSIYTEYPGYENDKLASGYVDTAINLSFVVNNKRLRASCYLSKAEILLDFGKTDEALQYAQKANLMADSLGINDFISGSYQALIDVYEKKKDKVHTLYYLDKYNTFLQHLNANAKKNSSQLMQDYFDLNSRLQKIDQAQRANQINRLMLKSQQKIIIILLISVIVMIGAFYIVYNIYKQKNKLANELGNQNISIQHQSNLIEAQAQRLDVLNNLKNKLLRVIGHDLRGPIGNLRNITDLFEASALTDEELQQVMKSMNPVVKGAELTLTNLLQWANNQINGSGVALSKVDLLPILEEMEQTFRHLLDQKNIVFNNNVSPKTMLLADENHLKVIFRNMISNAIKFTPANGSITIAARHKNDEVVISVADTGMGIKADDIGRLWSDKTQFSKAGTMGEIGTGIGLQLCHELIELNQGKVWVQSTVGRGTTFYVSLPVYR
jgi:signal transduction histidine kinase